MPLQFVKLQKPNYLSHSLDVKPNGSSYLFTMTTCTVSHVYLVFLFLENSCLSWESILIPCLLSSPNFYLCVLFCETKEQ